MDSLSQDIRHCLRTLARQPGFVIVAVLSLAFGIGINTAIFSAMNALLLRPPAVRDLDRTAVVYHAGQTNPDRGTSFTAFQHYRDRTGTFSAVMAHTGARPLLLTDGDRRVQVYAEPVTSSFFAIANITLSAGRPFDRDADRTIDPPLVAVLSHRFWHRQLASDPAIVGKAIVLNGRSFIITGVAAAGFIGLDPEVSVDLWIPLTTWAHLVGEPSRLTGEEHWLTTVATLNDDVSLEQAQAALATAARVLGLPPGDQTKVRSIRDLSPGSAVEALAIGGAAFAVGLLVLAVACVNVTSLLIARAAARQREMSVRLALGSSRGRLVRLWLIECAALSAMAAIVGLFVAAWMLDLVVAFKPPVEIGQTDTPTLPFAFQLDYRVFAFTLGLSVLTAVLVGLVAGRYSASGGTGLDVATGRVSDRRFAPGFNLRSTVIAAQMALCLILLIPCGLLIKGWLTSAALSPGFSAENVLLLPISTNQAGVRVQKPPGFERDLIDRVAALSGVESVTAMDPVPLWFGSNNAHFSVAGGPPPRQSHRLSYSRVAPGFFATLRIPLLRGRDFTRGDSDSAPRVAIVNETLARQFWPDGAALGKHIDRRDTVYQVVGIAADAKYLSLAETARPWVYVPLAQDPTNNVALSLAVRGTGDSMRLTDAIEREVRALVPSWPAFGFRRLDEGLEVQRLLPRFGATLLGTLGAFALVLATIGIYGVMAYVARQRTHEIGIRLALGAPQVSVVALVIRQGMAVCLAGGAIGIGVSLGVTTFLSRLLFEVGSADLLTYTVVPASLFAVALFACYLPARRVANVNPLEVLRRD